MFVHVVKEKGPIVYAIRRVVAEIQSLGYHRVIIKTDQEPTMIALKKAVIGHYLPTKQNTCGEKTTPGNKKT